MYTLLGIILVGGIGTGAVMLLYAVWVAHDSAKAGWKMAGRGVLVVLVSVIVALAS